MGGRPGLRVGKRLLLVRLGGSVILTWAVGTQGGTGVQGLQWFAGSAGLCGML